MIAHATLLTRLAKSIIASLVIITLLGCTTTQTLSRPSADRIKRAVVIGDSVTVVSTQSMNITGTITEITDVAIFVLSRAKKTKYKIPLAAIEHIEVHKLNRGRTTALLVGAGLVLVVVVLSSFKLDLGYEGN